MLARSALIVLMSFQAQLMLLRAVISRDKCFQMRTNNKNSFNLNNNIIFNIKNIVAAEFYL